MHSYIVSHHAQEANGMNSIDFLDQTIFGWAGPNTAAKVGPRTEFAWASFDPTKISVTQNKMMKCLSVTFKLDASASCETSYSDQLYTSTVEAVTVKSHMKPMRPFNL